MEYTPKTRGESKKNQKQKARPDKLGTSKGARIKTANLEKTVAAAKKPISPENTRPSNKKN